MQGKSSPAETSAGSVAIATPAEASTQQVQSNAGTPQNERIGEPNSAGALPQRSKVDIASRSNPESSDNDQLTGKRPHGRALPK
jgi:hypothetical protein